MGIYDREYVRTGRGASGGSGGPVGFGGRGLGRRFSCVTWLIIINAAVFMLDALLWSQNVGMMADMGRVYSAQATPEQINRAEPRRDPRTNQPLDVSSTTLRGAYAHRLIDPETGDVVGEHRMILMAPLQALFHFSTAKGFFGLEVWRFIGFQFLHANLMHIFFNMFVLYFFGPIVEQRYGPRMFLAFYLVCGLFGAVAYLLLNVLGQIFPQVPGLLFNDVYTPLIGASAGVFGVLMASAFLAPHLRVLFMFFIPMTMRTMIFLIIGVAVVAVLFDLQNAGGEAAHLGGAVAGAFFIRRMHLLTDFFDVFRPPKGRKPARPRKPSRGDAPKDVEVDRILAKVATQGLQSLTEAEKRILRSATDSKRR